jgi:hypothetical protein
MNLHLGALTTTSSPQQQLCIVSWLKAVGCGKETISPQESPLRLFW